MQAWHVSCPAVWNCTKKTSRRDGPVGVQVDAKRMINDQGGCANNVQTPNQHLQVRINNTNQNLIPNTMNEMINYFANPIDAVTPRKQAQPYETT